MMPVQEEKCFPRGGKELSEGKQKSSKAWKRKNWTLASSPVAIPEKRIATPENRAATPKKLIATPTIPTKSENPEDAVRNTVNNLSLKTLSEGNIILGYVRDVTDVELEINLPGLIVGYVPVAKISEEYCTYLKELLAGEATELLELTDMFKPGQLVVTRVEEISTVKRKTNVILSLIPERINRFMSVHDMTEGLLLSASIKSNEGQVYVMNCGVHGVKASMKKAETLNYENTWNNGKALGIGQVLRCLVTKCTSSEDSANVELTIDPEKLSECFVEKNFVPPNLGILGKCFQLSVQKVFQNGLLVKFTDHQFGYIHSNHLNGDFNRIKKNSLLPGRVLYLDLLNGDIFFTALKSGRSSYPPPSPFQEFKKGSRFSEAKVITKSGDNLLLEFGENSNYHGLVPMHHLDIPKNIHFDLAVLNFVKKKYPPGSYHECKVLEYDFMTEMYICTLKRYIIEQKYTSIDQLRPGIVEECTVQTISNKKITLELDGIHGFVEALHFSDVPNSYAHTKLRRGEKVKAKLLAVKNHLCEFTLKPALVNSRNPILTTFSDAKYGVQYDGVIVFINEKGMLVKFYANFANFVPTKNIFGLNNWDLKKLYYIGQVVKCHVLNIFDEEQKLFLYVQPLEAGLSKESSFKFPLKIGQQYTVIVKNITQEGLSVQEEVKGVRGRIPTSQLTDTPQIALSLSQTYKKGDKLQAICLNGGDKLMFSASPTFKKYFQSSAGKKLTESGLSQLQVGDVVPSIVAEIYTNRLILSLPLFTKTYSVFVASHNILCGIVKDVKSLGIQKNQTLMVRISGIFNDSIIEGECKLELVCNRTTMSENGIMLLRDFMISQKRIHNFWKNNGHPLGELEIGSQVEGTVVAVTSLGAVVNLDNGACAVVMPIHIDKGLNLTVNTRVKGTVMYLDVANQCAEITLWKHVQETFSLAEKFLDVGKHKKAMVYIARTDLLVCGVKYFSLRYIVYVPSRWHVNDLRPTAFFPVGAGSKLVIVECMDDMIFAVPRKVEVFERKYKKFKSDADNAEEDDSGEEIHSSETKDEIERWNPDNGKMLEESVDFISLKTDIHSKNMQTSPTNGTVYEKRSIQKDEQKETHGFEISDLTEPADVSQLEKNFLESQVDNSKKDEQEKKMKSKSVENDVNEKEMIEDSTISLNNEKLTNAEIKSKKQKKTAEIVKSFSLNESLDSSQIDQENFEHADVIKNKKQKKKKNKDSNSLEKSVNQPQTAESLLVTDENDAPKIKEPSDQTYDHLVVENNCKKQLKKKIAKDRPLCLEESSEGSQRVEEKLQELVINNENKTRKKKRKNSLEKSINEIQLTEESIASVNEKMDYSRNEIEKNDNLPISCVDESFNIVEDLPVKTKKKRKRKTVVNQSQSVDDATGLSNLVKENFSESVINNVSEPEINKKRKTDNSLVNNQNEVKNLLGSSMYLTKEIRTGNEEQNSRLNKNRREQKKKSIIECPDKTFLNVCAGFFWNATPDQLPAVKKSKNADTDSSSEDEAEVTLNKKKKQRLTMAEKRELARQEEERLRKVEERLMDAERNPVSADDFDRLVMSAPNDSKNWIKYMAYHLEATEVGKARAVAERALKTISFREEQEKLNVWVALLNLENLYGTQESLDKTLEEAVKMNDSYKIHMQVLNMYSTTKKLEELDKMVQLVTKKYKRDINTWIEAGLACIKCGEIEKSRHVMQRALTILDKKYHVEVLTRFARMENEWGESERAETLMENILTSYPKRTDVWSVYVDMLVKSKKFDIARQVLDRAVIQKLPVSKMKTLFKKYLTFEQTHGTPDRVEKIREMAKNFVENLKSNIA